MRIVTAVLIAGCGLGALACGSNRDEFRTPAATVERGSATAAPGGTAAPTSGVTSTPAPDPTTPAPTATSTLVPSPAELVFTDADGSDGTKTPRSSGPLGVVYADASIGRPAVNRVQATAFVNIGVNERPSASAWLVNSFRAPGDGASVTAQVSTNVAWKGVLAGNGAAGTGASVTIQLSVLDGASTVASTVVHANELRESALSVGGADDIGSAVADLTAILVPGRLYQLRLTLTCEATSGLIGAATHCIFGESEVYEQGYVSWGPRTIVFAP